MQRLRRLWNRRSVLHGYGRKALLPSAQLGWIKTLWTTKRTHELSISTSQEQDLFPFITHVRLGHINSERFYALPQERTPFVFRRRLQCDSSIYDFKCSDTSWIVTLLNMYIKTHIACRKMMLFCISHALAGAQVGIKQLVSIYTSDITAGFTFSTGLN